MYIHQETGFQLLVLQNQNNSVSLLGFTQPQGNRTPRKSILCHLGKGVGKEAWFSVPGQPVPSEEQWQLSAQDTHKIRLFVSGQKEGEVYVLREDEAEGLLEEGRQESKRWLCQLVGEGSKEKRKDKDERSSIMHKGTLHKASSKDYDIDMDLVLFDVIS